MANAKETLRTLFARVHAVDASDVPGVTLLRLIQSGLVEVFPFMDQEENSRVSVELTHKGEKLVWGARYNQDSLDP